jgi:hypothetical protein
MTLKAGSSLTTDQGTLELIWLPSPSINFHISVDRIIPINETPVQVILDEVDRVLSGYLFQPGFRVNESGSSMTFRGPILGEHSPAPVNAQRVTFHLVNFHNYLGESVAYTTPSGSSGSGMGRLKVSNQKWSVIIDKIQYDDSIWTELGRSRGYGITHTGEICRVDGSLFPVAEAEEVLDALVFFLAFIRGIWVGPILVTYEDDSIIEWLDLKLRNTSRWHSTKNWFPTSPIKSDGDLGHLFSEFIRLWADDTWKHVLRTSVFWYVESSTSQSTEAGLVSVATALELLFWVYFVESSETSQFSKKIAGHMSLERKLHMLLELSNYQKEIPEHFDELRSIANQLDAKYSEGPKVFARLRNSIVHPKQRHRKTLFDIPPYAKIQAQFLGLEYFERTLLHMLGYKGAIENRDRLFKIVGG